MNTKQKETSPMLDRAKCLSLPSKGALNRAISSTWLATERNGRGAILCILDLAMDVPEGTTGEILKPCLLPSRLGNRGILPKHSVDGPNATPRCERTCTTSFSCVYTRLQGETKSLVPRV